MNHQTGTTRRFLSKTYNVKTCSLFYSFSFANSRSQKIRWYRTQVVVVTKDISIRMHLMYSYDSSGESITQKHDVINRVLHYQKQRDHTTAQKLQSTHTHTHIHAHRGRGSTANLRLDLLYENRQIQFCQLRSSASGPVTDPRVYGRSGNFQAKPFLARLEKQRPNVEPHTGASFSF